MQSQNKAAESQNKVGGEGGGFVVHGCVSLV